MDLDLALKVIGWVMSLTPMVVFVVISFCLIWGASKDDDSIKGLVMLGVGIFSVGMIILVMTYVAGFSANLFLE
jgi:hypothetical protein